VMYNTVDILSKFPSVIDLVGDLQFLLIFIKRRHSILCFFAAGQKNNSGQKGNYTNHVLAAIYTPEVNLCQIMKTILPCITTVPGTSSFLKKSQEV
jgi:hypothetical protein